MPQPALRAVRRRLVPAAVVTALAVPATVLAPAPAPVATAATPPAVGYEMPFACGEEWRGTTRRNHSPHRRAVDFNRWGDAGRPVVAAASGTVTHAYAKPRGGYGRWVRIDHGSGEASLYAHLRRVSVRRGQTIDQGEMLGLVGASGNTSGAHLHYERILDRTLRRAWFAGSMYRFGVTQASRNCVDVPVAGNFVGGPAAEPAVFRRRANRGVLIVRRVGQRNLRFRLGSPYDQPLVGDWDGDGRADRGLRRGKRNAFILRSAEGIQRVRFGSRFDLPVVGDWDGDGRWEVGLRRPGRSLFRLRQADGSVIALHLGTSTDLPVTGDWNGDGTTDVGVFDPGTATWTLALVGSTEPGWPATVRHGSPGDLPVTGDWNGDGTTDLGSWTPGTAVHRQRIAPDPRMAPRRVATFRFGRTRR